MANQFCDAYMRHQAPMRFIVYFKTAGNIHQFTIAFLFYSSCMTEQNIFYSDLFYSCYAIDMQVFMPIKLDPDCVPQLFTADVGIVFFI